MLGLPRLQGFSITLSLKNDKTLKLKIVLGFCQQSKSKPLRLAFFILLLFWK
ncbi:hypothetical protein CHCC20375_2628 [Bacillus licheniformis]|nr:hypothetical protein CHCC20375_2628 [Bacillus licheniformis]